MPLPFSPLTGRARIRGFVGTFSAGAPIPEEAAAFWLSDDYDSRYFVSVENPYAFDVFDQLVTASIPATIDTGSLTAVEVNLDRTVDNAYGWRTSARANRMPYLPVSWDGSQAKIKALGRWQPQEVRYFALYWDSTGVATAPAITHLAPAGRVWTVAITAGTTGDHYVIVAGGETYDHTMTAGQTANQIALALETLIDAGDVANSSVVSSTLSIIQRDGYQFGFTVADTGSTVPNNLNVTAPGYYGLARIGPDTETPPATTGWNLGLPYNALNSQSNAQSRASLARATANEVVRLLAYKLNGDATVYGFTASVPTAITLEGPEVVVTGTLSGSTHWSGTYEIRYQNKICSLSKSDGTGANSILKQVDIARCVFTFTCIQAYTPINDDSGAGTMTLNQYVLGVHSGMSFTGNNTTIPSEELATWFCHLSTAPAVIASSGSTAGMSIGDSIVGNAGNTGAYGVRVIGVSFEGFSPQVPIAKWWGSQLQIASTSNASQIPLDAQIVVEFWYAHSTTNSALATGDNMVPTELANVLKGIENVGALSSSAVESYETYSVDSLAKTMELATAKTVQGIQWFADNALAYTNVAVNTAYAATEAGSVRMADDDDGSYGEGHKQHGLCLLYLRTHDALLIPQIERQAQYHLDIETAATATYGANYPAGNPTAGSASYWFNPLSVPYTHATGDTTQPGEPRGKTSIDQMHMVGHGLYAYMYLLRNEAAITANTTLRANILAYVGRMRDYQLGGWGGVSSVTRAMPNLYKILTGVTPTDANGFGAGDISDPYWGTQFIKWQINNEASNIISPSSNSTIDWFFRSVYSPNANVAAITRFLQGNVNDMVASDASRHDVEFVTTTWGIPGTHRPGWMLRAGATANDWKYSAGRTGDDHYITINAGGAIARDSLTGRAAQRLIVLCLAALFDPTYVIPIEREGGATVRSVPILEAVDDLANTLAVYGAHPAMKGQRFSISGFAGAGEPTWVDSAFTGYWMMASELWYLVKAGADFADYYPIGLWP